MKLSITNLFLSSYLFCIFLAALLYANAQDMDECEGGCHANATCTNNSGSFACSCKTGFIGDGMNCSDINECYGNERNCSVDATCTNYPGSFSCSCNSGFTGDGMNCLDINECKDSDPGCHANATCTNNPGNFSCSCNSGFTGDGISCSVYSTTSKPENSTTSKGSSTTTLMGIVFLMSMTLHLLL